MRDENLPRQQQRPSPVGFFGNSQGAYLRIFAEQFSRCLTRFYVLEAITINKSFVKTGSCSVDRINVREQSSLTFYERNLLIEKKP